MNTYEGVITRALLSIPVYIVFDALIVNEHTFSKICSLAIFSLMFSEIYVYARNK